MDGSQVQGLLRSLEPNQPLGGKLLGSYYVDRGSTFRARLRQVLQSKGAKAFVAGPSGVGKSTELAKFVEDLEEGAYGILIDVGGLYDLTKIGPIHLLLAGAWKGLNLGAARGWKPTPEVQRKSRWWGAKWDNAKNYFTFEAEKAVNSSFGSVHQRSEETLLEVEAGLGRPTVLVYDGLEKLPTNIARAIFCTNGAAIASWAVRAVFVVPPLLLFGPEWEEAERHVADTLFLSALPVAGPSGDETDRARGFFRDLADRRLGPLAMKLDPTLLEKAIDEGAGIPRQFLHVLRETFMESVVEGRDIPDAGCLERALARLRSPLQRKLRPGQVDRLRELHQKPPATLDVQDHDLLATGCLIPYESGGRLWYDANPILLPVLV
ncbi:MAG: hypothetical protein HYY17_09080 [Planctomycetes bacterium]|nr:hypothetical protein [Planctomycetota bacterium]